MKHVDEFRDPAIARQMIESIRRRASRRWAVMEVCGGQTHSLLRHGIAEALSDCVELIHGPGCPVCVTPAESIDFAQRLAFEPGVVVTSFGDMLRVPGTARSLLAVRALGGDVRPVYSPLDAVTLAQREPLKQVVFFAVGFETTAPATALAVLQAERLGLRNFSLLAAHVRVQPAMEAILAGPGNRVQAFLAAGHVCTVTGYDAYSELAARHRVPIAVTGFEPLDLLEGISDCVRQLESGTSDVTNRYGRVVSPGGNAAAQDVVSRVYEVVDRPWRGLGVIPQGGLALRREYRCFDAAERFAMSIDVPGGDGPPTPNETVACLSGEVLSGRIRPIECPHFGQRCTPDSPLGAPMVSSEGACAAYFRHQSVRSAGRG